MRRPESTQRPRSWCIRLAVRWRSLDFLCRRLKRLLLCAAEARHKPDPGRRPNGVPAINSGFPTRFAVSRTDQSSGGLRPLHGKRVGGIAERGLLFLPLQRGRSVPGRQYRVKPKFGENAGQSEKHEDLLERKRRLVPSTRCTKAWHIPQ